MSLQNTQPDESGQVADCLDNQAGIGRESGPSDADRDSTSAPTASPTPRRNDDDLYARVPVALLRSRPTGVGDGAMMMLLMWLCWRARWTGRVQNRRDTPVRLPASHWAAEIGVSRRQAKRWVTELREAGLIVRSTAPTGMATSWMIPETGPPWEGPRVDVPLALIHRLARRPELVATWALLRSYVSEQTGTAWPGQERLRRDLGVAHRTTVSDRISRLADLGFIEARRRPNRGRAYEYRVMVPDPDQEGTKTRHNPDDRKGGTKTRHNRGQKPDITGDKNPTSVGTKTRHNRGQKPDLSLKTESNRLMTTIDDKPARATEGTSTASPDPVDTNTQSVDIVISDRSRDYDGEPSPAASEQVASLDAARTATDKWNTLARLHGLDEVRYTTPRRLEALRVLLDCYGPDIWDRALAEIGQTKYLQGAGDQGWRVTLSWLLKDDHCVHVAEGQYRPRITTPTPTPGRNTKGQKEKQIGKHQLDWLGTQVDEQPNLVWAVWEALHAASGEWPTQRQLLAAHREAIRSRRSAPAGAADTPSDDAEAIRARAWWVELDNQARTWAALNAGFNPDRVAVDMSDDSPIAAEAWHTLRRLTAEREQRARRTRAARARPRPAPRTRAQHDAANADTGDA